MCLCRASLPSTQPPFALRISSTLRKSVPGSLFLPERGNDISVCSSRQIGRSEYFSTTSLHFSISLSFATRVSSLRSLLRPHGRSRRRVYTALQRSASGMREDCLSLMESRTTRVRGRTVDDTVNRNISRRVFQPRISDRDNCHLGRRRVAAVASLRHSRSYEKRDDDGVIVFRCFNVSIHDRSLLSAKARYFTSELQCALYQIVHYASRQDHKEPREIFN